MICRRDNRETNEKMAFRITAKLFCAMYYFHLLQKVQKQLFFSKKNPEIKIIMGATAFLCYLFYVM